MNARVFWMDTAGGEPGDGAWYWREQDENFNDVDDVEAHGPFEAAIQAGADARKAIVAAAERQAINFEDRS